MLRDSVLSLTLRATVLRTPKDSEALKNHYKELIETYETLSRGASAEAIAAQIQQEAEAIAAAKVCETGS